MSLLKAEAALKAHALAVQDMQLGYQLPSTNLEETDFEGLLQAATDRHTNARSVSNASKLTVWYNIESQDSFM